ncbi:MAG TPA: cytochrome c biogenesis protein DipZ [Solirubrobacteraceae bacterium]|jgi:cytochrome c biogenesis protein CcdA/thiol-disulfide isomerase/thioredoxin|nr:cytochrome c biogenesis protein DipZ [Solirubrobacteraceae bacterium]
MLLLLAFAVLAGAGTALSPCVLPVLPALLASGGVGGKRRPLGVVIGLTVTFTVTIVGIADVVDGVGLGSDPLRYLAVAVLLLAGLALLVPSVADRVEARMSRLAAFGVGGARDRGDGFRSGLLVGAALGFVYTPCAGPILAAVISVSAASGRSIAVAIAYSLGSAAVLLGLILGGRSLFDRVRAAGRGPALQRTLGAVMLITAVAILAGVDVNFDQYVAEHIPNVNLTAGLEKSKAVESRLHEITGREAKYAQTGGKAAVAAKNASDATLLADARGLKDLGEAPEFRETGRWFNTPGGRPLTLSSLHGRVVLVDFWTYTCINCIRTLPYLKAWDATYRKAGLTIVGVHTPEFAFEHDASNVQNAIERFGLRYPVVQDNNMGTWNAYGNQYWPADYLIDASGHVRYAAAGEGDYAQTETAIRALLAEAGHSVGAISHPTHVVTPSEVATPETYLGTARGQGWRDGPHEGTHYYGAKAPTQLALNEFAYSGTWSIAAQPATALSGAGIDAEFEAKNAYLVLSSQGETPRTVQVLLDGRPIAAKDAGADVHGGTVTVRGQRLYSLVSLPTDEERRLSLRLAPGVSGYAFTFG